MNFKALAELVNMSAMVAGSPILNENNTKFELDELNRANLEKVEDFMIKQEIFDELDPYAQHFPLILSLNKRIR